MRKLFYCTMIVFLSSFSIGCSAPVSSAQRTVPAAAINTEHPRARLVLGSDDLIGRIALLDPRFREVGLLNQAQVTVQNLTQDRYTLEYKVEWEDNQGFAIGSNAMWQRFTLTPNQVQRFKSVGKTPEAKKINFTVRLPDDAFIDYERRNR